LPAALPLSTSEAFPHRHNDVEHDHVHGPWFQAPSPAARSRRPAAMRHLVARSLPGFRRRPKAMAPTCVFDDQDCSHHAGPGGFTRKVACLRPPAVQLDSAAVQLEISLRMASPRPVATPLARGEEVCSPAGRNRLRRLAALRSWGPYPRVPFVSTSMADVCAPPAGRATRECACFRLPVLLHRVWSRRFSPTTWAIGVGVHVFHGRKLWPPPSLRMWRKLCWAR